jgi:glycosyltransferase involved in cell wall biosynthesis
MMPKISIVMPAYNSEKFLGEAVQSILNQTFTDFEFIIINDGSNDNTLSILKKFAQSDKRIKLFSRENKGLVYTLNEGLHYAKSPLLARMDADDISRPQRLQKQFEFITKKDEFVAIGSEVMLIDSEGMPIRKMGVPKTHDEIDQAHMNCLGGAIIHPVSMYRTADAKKIKYREAYIHAEDLDFWLRLAEIGRLGNLPDTLLEYRQHHESIGYKKSEIQKNSAYNAILSASQRRRVNQPDKQICKNKNASNFIDKDDIHRKWAFWALKGANVSTARKHANKALISNPGSLSNWKVWLCSLRGY